MVNKSNMVQRIIGQETLTNEIERIFDIFTNSECQIRSHFILTGESGSGKSFIIKNLTLKYKLGFIEVNAAQLTKEGTAGNSLSTAYS